MRRTQTDPALARFTTRIARRDATERRARRARTVCLAVGLVVVLMLIIGGIQYLTSFGDATAIKNAKNRITNAIIALMLFLLMYAILSFLLPGTLTS